MLAITALCVLTGFLIYYQVFTQGLFGSLIMAVAAIVASQVALNYYEPLAALLADLGMSFLSPATISLLVLFAGTLFLLRELSDRFIRGNMKFPQIMDRIGSSVFAVISSLTITGMIALGFQVSAMPAVLLGFDRCPELRNSQEDKSFFPKGDDFVLSMMGHTSKYCFSGQNSFSQVHPDMLRDLYLNRLIPENYQGTRNEAAKDSVRVTSAKFASNNLKNLDTNLELELDTDERLLLVQLTIKGGSAKRGDRGAADVDKEIRVALADFRLVGFDPADRGSEVYCRYPLGYLSSDSQSVKLAPLDKGRHTSSRSAKVGLLFTWPRKAKKVLPLFIDFKHSARGDINLKKLRESLRED